MFLTSSVVFDIFVITAVIAANLFGLFVIIHFVSNRVSNALFKRDEFLIDSLIRKMKEEGFRR